MIFCSPLFSSKGSLLPNPLRMLFMRLLPRLLMLPVPALHE